MAQWKDRFVISIRCRSRSEVEVNGLRSPPFQGAHGSLWLACCHETRNFRVTLPIAERETSEGKKRDNQNRKKRSASRGQTSSLSTELGVGERFDLRATIFFFRFDSSIFFLHHHWLAFTTNSLLYWVR